MALGQVDHEAMINKRPHNFQAVLPDCLRLCAMWVDVIDVYFRLHAPRDVLDDVSDDGLECGGCSEEAKRHAVINPHPILGYDTAVAFAVLV